jgi:transposase-like protein
MSDSNEVRARMSESPRGRNARAARREAVARLTLKGLTVPQIAAQLGISTATVSRDQARCRMEWKNSALRSTDEHVTLDTQRLETLLAGVWDLAELGDLDAVNTALKVLMRRAKLLGLDAKANLDVTLETAEESSLIAKIEWMAKNLEAGRGIETGWGDDVD